MSAVRGCEGAVVRWCGVLILAAVSVPSAQTPYRAPRTLDGQPDLQGIWQAVNTAVWNIQDHPAELGIPAGQGIVEGNEIPYLPLALPQRQVNYRNRLTADPETKCFMVGTPRINYMPYPFEIVQTPTQITILYEYVHTSRHLRLNSTHPEGAIRWFMGDSRALGRRDAGRGRHPFHRSELARSVGQLSQRGHAPRRTLDAHGTGSPVV